jgi:hypothetical protein
MTSPRVIATTFGLFFILTFLSYGAGSSIIDMIVSVPDVLSNVDENKLTLVIGVVLITLVHTFFNIGLPVIMLPIIKPHNPYLAYGYLSAAIVATIVLTIGALLLLLMVPLSDHYVTANTTTKSSLDILGRLLIKGGFYAYHIGMSLWGMGSLMFVIFLYQSKLIPRIMSIWGLIGYLLLISGSISQLFEHNAEIEIYSVVLGGSFEMTLSIWLIIKGFNIRKNNTQRFDKSF